MRINAVHQITIICCGIKQIVVLLIIFLLKIKLSKDYYGKKRDAWLLTDFEKKNSASDNTMDTAGTLTGEGNDTATSQDTVSGNKDNTPFFKYPNIW